MTETDIENAMNGWNTEGRLPGCEADWTPRTGGPSPGHVLDCQCPPYTCKDCGRSQGQRDVCACWTSVEGLPLADLKAIFALGDLSVERNSWDGGGNE